MVFGFVWGCFFFFICCFLFVCFFGFLPKFHFLPLNLLLSGQIHLGGSKCNCIDSNGILSAYVSNEFGAIFIGNIWAAIRCGKSC